MIALSPMPSGAPVLRRIALLLGWLSMLATLALPSPGVVATASADELAASQRSEPGRRKEDQTTRSPGPLSVSPRPTSSGESSPDDRGLRSMSPKRRRDVVSLNTSGYNYPTGRRAGATIALAAF
jgi:hypothetical protein